jgi:murein DD-endopeptidase MepM/ murein hydrolase activator NlpD
MADGSFACSLYAHLSPFVHVKPGDRARKGQKIGSIGRSHTWENGGYRAHLHFGIHAGRYVPRYEVGRRIPLRRNGKDVHALVVRSDERRTTVWIEETGGEHSFRNDAHWICGYIDPARFRAGRHGWLDPQRFLQRRAGSAVREGSGGG